MDFAARITRLPLAYDAALGQEAAEAFGGEGALFDLLKGAAGTSPYLHALLAKHGAWCRTALDAPEAALAALGGEAAHLRRDKGRAALLIALCDLAGIWPLEDVTGALSAFADRALHTALQAALAPHIARGALPAAPGLFILAMGKLGARELNYSSDIDLICLFDDDGLGPGEAQERRSVLVRAVRTTMKALSDVTGEGYVFRTDLRLRPDAAVTPIVLSTSAALAYYESVGRTWERAAHIKARVAAGDAEAGARYLRALAPFIWRKHLDFPAIEDAHDMLSKIRAHRGLKGPITLRGHDMKLGRGGIREIEFFAQTRQLIAGGRDPSLRAPETRAALRALKDAGWVDEPTRATLDRAYASHREVEHRLQMLRDAQTHSLPKTDGGMARLAAFMGLDAGGLERRLAATLESAHALTEPFFTPPRRVPDAEGAPARDFGRAVTDRWESYPALRSERAARLFARVRPRLLARLAQAQDPERALNDFDAFLSRLPAGVQIFSLLDANPDLADLLADIAAVAPALAEYLGRNAGVLDAVLSGGFFSAWPGRAALVEELETALSAADGYEAALTAARVYARDWHFRIGVHFLRGLIDAETAGRQYADLAEAVLAALFPRVTDDFTRRHGPPPGLGAALIAMGSLGAGRLHPASDLDLILVYDAAGEEASIGPRPLAARAYYTRLTQALITALTAPMGAGKLYEVDLRLRPSGRNGPLATSLAAFRAYQKKDAWTWEHLALTRARVVCGPQALARRIEEVRCEIVRRPRDSATLATNVQDMRHRIFAARPGAEGLAAKDGPGRLQDVELFAQMLALLSKSDAREISAQIAAGEGAIGEGCVAALAAHQRRLWHVRLVTRLVLKASESAEWLAGQGAAALLLRDVGAADQEALKATLARDSGLAARLFEETLVGLGAPR
ncbi:MAG: glutamine-synthetase adenylyltransferase [Pseudomonadota bacterium]